MKNSADQGEYWVLSTEAEDLGDNTLLNILLF